MSQDGGRPAGGLDVDVHSYVQQLGADTDPRWRAALTRATGIAEPVWARAPAGTRVVHELGLGMLAIGLFVAAAEGDTDPERVPLTVVAALLEPVSTDRLWRWAGDWWWKTDPEYVAMRARPDRGREQQWFRDQRAGRDTRLRQLRDRVEVGFVLAGVDLRQRRVAPAHRDLISWWRYLLSPAMPSSDIGGEPPSPTDLPYLPEGAMRAGDLVAAAGAAGAWPAGDTAPS